MFRKILIANRGEIACRVITTARRLGVQTVAVYSDADASAKHVAMADEAVRIGPAPVAESYLLGAQVIQAALDTGAQAVHPGYGFLSENPDFVEAVEAAGLVFIGPTADAIRAMGLKDAAKTLMQKAGVPVVPGYHGAEQEAGFLAKEAESIGYPVMIKARAGGGGKGMRMVDTAADFTAALEGAQREGKASFGDAACLIEKYIQRPRHIEMQVFGDTHGNVVHMFERDCSLQRRHQKVIEEAPAPDMTDEMRAAMGNAAVEAAKAIGYQGAGTVEFIVDGADGLRPDGFWFMEMNTRLQVEHPVSEAITGYDFVELQIRIAAGEALPMRQKDISANGHAFEARIYAEDVPKGFLPSTGILTHLSFAKGTEFAPGSVRIDSGVRQGDEISPWYDPMIAKVIVHGPTREAALGQLSAALADCHVVGSVTNIGFLGALARHDGFAKGEVDTDLIARDIDALTAETAPSQAVTGLAVVAALGLLVPRGTGAWDALQGWRQWGLAEQFVALTLGEEHLDVHITIAKDSFGLRRDNAEWDISVNSMGGTKYAVTQKGVRQTLDVVQTHGHVTVFDSGHAYDFAFVDGLAGAEAEEGGDTVVSPMPGLVKLVMATSGQQVSAGDALMVLEAMKMEYTLRAPRDGIIAEMLAAEGDQVADGSLLVQLEPEPDLNNG